jgi:hypothetical protein
MPHCAELFSGIRRRAPDLKYVHFQFSVAPLGDGIMNSENSSFAMIGHPQAFNELKKIPG